MVMLLLISDSSNKEGERIKRKKKCLGVELQFLAEEVLIISRIINIVIEEIQEPRNPGEGNDDGGPGG
jgi:hypothetical protein